MIKGEDRMDEEKALKFIRIEKEILSNRINFPKQNEFLMLNAVSKGNPKEKFIIDINRKRATLSRCSFQQRAYITIPLIRLDIDNKPHKNPDEKVIEGNHIHIYKEGFNLAWAYSLNDPFIKQINPNFDTMLFKKLASHGSTFINFCKFCNITKIPAFQINDML